MTEQSLNPLTLPFTGTQLIEASAGTGKTYTIAALYIRLILGYRLPTAYQCEQILVVTFTNAATEELRARIRSRLKLAYRRFIGLAVNDQFIEELYQQTPVDEHHLARKRLDLALKSLDEASIFTIHGFCQRILTDMAFESSLLFETEFTLDDREYLHHSVRDFWRDTCYQLPEYIANLIQKKIGCPDTLVKNLKPLLGIIDAQKIHPAEPVEFKILTTRLNKELDELKRSWLANRDKTEQLLLQLPLNGSSFGKKDENHPKLAKMFDSMDNWAQLAPLTLPDTKVLNKLSLTKLKLNKGSEYPTEAQAPLLAKIEILDCLIEQLIPSFLVCARQGISNRFYRQKLTGNVITPDDLLDTLAKALAADADAIESDGLSLEPSLKLSLNANIARRFPIALIDEFQDTDPLQYQIFASIYRQKIIEDDLGLGDDDDAHSLLMIGDPKQAIYSFRGADIDTYIAARQQTAARYSLDTNYRSSINMIAAVNQIFSGHPQPFINQQIPFISVQPSPLASDKQLIEQPSDHSALRIRLLREEPEKGLNKATARMQLAEDMGNQIATLLTEAANGLCLSNNKPIKAQDIAVLVRDKNEAAYVKDALTKRNVGAVFLSRDSIFNTLEAEDLALVLVAIAKPKDEQTIRSALATKLLGFNADAIHQFNVDEDIRQNLLEQFTQLHHLWLTRGIMPCLLTMARDTHLIDRLLSDDNGDRRMTNFRHLSELLQQKATEIDGMSALINWYQQTLVENQATETAQLRLESEQNLVQIVTIHKSKGLEYPICFVPFISLAATSRKPTPMLYHQDGQLVWDIAQSDAGKAIYLREKLAEDLRLLYVALTRPMLACYLYIANYSSFTAKKGLSSKLAQTAIGYLLGIDDERCTFNDLELKTQKLCSEAISVTNLANNDEIIHLNPSEDHFISPTVKPLKRIVGLPWRMTSYSGLIKHNTHNDALENTATIEAESIEAEPVEYKASRFTFERGANAGSFMHMVLENIDFTKADSQLSQQLPAAMDKYAIDHDWQAVLEHWYKDLLAAPLDDEGLNLSCLPPAQTLVEMEFHLPISRLKAEALNRLLEEFGYRGGLEFNQLQGMLKGFIDLSFHHSNRFYIADYKSNHLGNNFAYYQPQKLQVAIRAHRYDLQYIIYTLALHRYLKQRVEGYHYDKDFGGCYYLFLRGMSKDIPKSGVYFDKPARALIERLDLLFDQETGDH